MPQALKRIIIKLSGEALADKESHFSHRRFCETAEMLIAIKQTGVQLAVVTGGGNVWRGRRGPATDMGAVAADQMGMLATLQNSLYLCDALKCLGGDAAVMTAVEMPRFAEPYNTAGAIERLERGQIVLLACGLGNPYFSTDSAVALRAMELQCDAIFMAKNVNGVYTADPCIDSSAKLISDISYAEAAERDLRAMDAAAFILLRDNSFPLVRLFKLEPPENALKVLRGDPMGTTMHP